MLRDQHIKFGRHSQIPECCIQYFVTEWDSDFKRYGSAQIRDPENVGYVRCLNCLRLKKQNKVHICFYACREFLESIGRTDLAQQFKKPKPEDLWMSISNSTNSWWTAIPDSNVVIQNDPLTFRGIMHPQQMVYIDEANSNHVVAYENLVNDPNIVLYNTPLRDDPDRT